MDVAAECELGVRRHDAARGIPCILDIAPSRGIAGFGMNVEAIVLLQRQRQLRQKTPLGRAQPAARPLDRGLGFGIHRFRRGADGIVVVAAHRHGAALDQIHHCLDRPFRIGAIADVIAEENHALGAMRPRQIEARGKSLPVGMDIGEDGQQHAYPPRRSHRPA